MVKRKSKNFLEVQHFNGFLNEERDVDMWGTVFTAEGTATRMYLVCSRNRTEVRVAEQDIEWAELESRRQQWAT